MASFLQKTLIPTSRVVSRTQFQRRTLPRIVPSSVSYLRLASTMAHKLKDPSLFKENVCYVNGEWIPAKSGKTFQVTGTVTPPRQPTWPPRDAPGSPLSVHCSFRDLA